MAQGFGAASSVQLTDAQRLDWLRLIRSEGIGPRTFRSLIDRFGNAAAALDMLPELSRRRGRAIRIATREEAEREWTQASRLGVTLIALGEEAYPKTLQAIDDAPPLLAVRGHLSCLRRPCLAIVGSRNASGAGLRMAEKLALEMGNENYVIVSGLARGIDRKAHEAALDNGTVAVLAGGHDRIYPPEHEELLHRILDRGGTAVSEMPMGWEPRGRDFPRRNRIISGLSLGTLVVEAARRSGSLITARFALEQGREVFAVPGSPLDPRAEGTNDLLRQGATLVATSEHLSEALRPLLQGDLPLPRAIREDGRSAAPGEPLWDELDLGDADGSTSAEEVPVAAAVVSIEADEWVVQDRAPAGKATLDIVVELLSPSPVGIDELARLAALPVREVQRVLFELELSGRIERHGQGLVSLA